MIAQIFFELRGIATLRITLTYHFLALCGAAIALAVVIPAEVKDMGWSKAISMVAMLAVIVGLLTHIILHRKSEPTSMHSPLH
jgi:cyanate permease